MTQYNKIQVEALPKMSNHLIEYLISYVLGGIVMNQYFRYDLPTISGPNSCCDGIVFRLFRFRIQ